MLEIVNSCGVVSVISAKNGIDAYIIKEIKRKCGSGVKPNIVRIQQDILNTKYGLVAVFHRLRKLGEVYVVMLGIPEQRLKELEEKCRYSFDVFSLSFERWGISHKEPLPGNQAPESDKTFKRRRLGKFETHSHSLQLGS